MQVIDKCIIILLINCLFYKVSTFIRHREDRKKRALAPRFMAQIFESAAGSLEKGLKFICSRSRLRMTRRSWLGCVLSTVDPPIAVSTLAVSDCLIKLCISHYR